MRSYRIQFLQRMIETGARNPVWRRTSSWKLRRIQLDLQVAVLATGDRQPVEIRLNPRNNGTRA